MYTIAYTETEVDQPPDYPVLHLPHSPPNSDFTTYLGASPDGPIEKMLQELRPPEGAGSTYSIDRSVRLECEDGGASNIARIVACKCFGARKWSVTIRSGGSRSSGSSLNQEDLGSNFKASSEYHDEFLTSFSVLCEILDGQIFFEKRRRTGLIVVTGATASGKSEITRGLIELRMQKAAEAYQQSPKTTRRPHLITIEDPIEKFYVKSDPFRQPRNFDYTPRQKGIDALNLKSVFRDALRQTPTLVFVGEIRDPREWADVLDFASTGHSVIATAHAGSLAEAWGKILAATKASTAAGRSDAADRILGIVHLRSFAEAGLKGVLPALWRYTATGAMALVADGRSSLLPLRDVPCEEQSSLGRTRFMHEIVERMRRERDLLHESPHPILEKDTRRIDVLSGKVSALEKNRDFEQALLRSDLEGL